MNTIDRLGLAIRYLCCPVPLAIGVVGGPIWAMVAAPVVGIGIGLALMKFDDWLDWVGPAPRPDARRDEFRRTYESARARGYPTDEERAFLKAYIQDADP